MLVACFGALVHLRYWLSGLLESARCTGMSMHALASLVKCGGVVICIWDVDEGAVTDCMRCHVLCDPGVI